MEADEGRKTKQLLRELRTEYGSSKLDWIYSQKTAGEESEEYLLGKRVDKAFEASKSGPIESRVGFADIPQPTLKVGATEDLKPLDSRKISEDPLLLIKQREEAARHAWLNHPLRLKELQKQKEEEEKKNRAAQDLDRKLAKKLAKLKKHSPEFIDELLNKKVKKLKGINIKELLAETSSSSDSDSEPVRDRRIAERLTSESYQERKREMWKRGGDHSDEEREKRGKDGREREKFRRREDYNERRREHSDSDSERAQWRERQQGRSKRDEKRSDSDSDKDKEKSGRDRFDYEKNARRRDDSESEKSSRRRRKDHGGIEGEEKRRRDNSSSEREERSRKKRDDTNRSEQKSSKGTRDNLRQSLSPERPPSKKIGGLDRLGKSPPRVKEVKHEKRKEPERIERRAKVALTAEEMEKRRLEMQSDAKMREKERAERVAKYREEATKEENDHKKDKDPEFLKRELAKAASISTVEGRIRSNVANIQRGKVAMEKNFARR